MQATVAAQEMQKETAVSNGNHVSAAYWTVKKKNWRDKQKIRGEKKIRDKTPKTMMNSSFKKKRKTKFSVAKKKITS